jgi:hypothetical protein
VRTIVGVVIVLSVASIVGGVISLNRHDAKTAVRAAETSTQTSALATPPATLSASTEPQPTPIVPAALESEFEELEKSLDAKVGLVVTGVGAGGRSVPLGNWETGAAWSTIKVALALAVLREQGDVTGPMRAAIINSDNDAAESLWESLGPPETAAAKVGDVLRGYGDPTIVESQRTYPPFSAFGQTDWSLHNAATFVAGAVCDGRNDPIFDLMRQIAPDQQWGLGTLPDTQYKGGWGPSRSGGYLVRQIGVLETPGGRVAVAMAAQPASGSFAEGTSDLNKIARWLNDHTDALPFSQC